MIHHIKVTQVLRVERETTMEVDAESHEAAIELIAYGEVDLPTDAWTVSGEAVQNEEYA